MGLGTESALIVQVKKAREDSNDRLDKLVDVQRETNDLLRQLLAALRSR